MKIILFIIPSKNFSYLCNRNRNIALSIREGYMKQSKTEKAKRYNHSFASRLTRWVMLVLLIMMSALGYFIYEMSKSIVVEFSVNTFHTNMQASSKFFSNVMSDVSEAVKNHLFELEQHIGQPAQLEKTIARIVELNPRIKKCKIIYPDDPTDSVWFREVVAADSAFWSEPFFDSSEENMPAVAYLQPLHDQQGRVAAVLSAGLPLDFMTQQGELLDSVFHEDVFLIDIANESDFHSYVIMHDGTYITHPKRWPILKGNFYDHIKDADDSGQASLAIEQMKKGERSYSEEKKVLLVNRTKSYLFYIPIDNCDWIQAVSVPAIIINLFGIIVGIVMVIVIVLMLFATSFVCHITIQHIAKPLKQLAATADKVASGTFDTPLPPIKSYDEIHLLRDSFENMQHSLTAYVEELQSATTAKASMESELKIAHDIQMSMLPKTYPAFPDRHDIDIYGFVMPAKAVGGDLYDFFIRDDKLFFCIGDVSGKGVPASLVMAVTRFLFRNVASYTQYPHQIAVALNEALSTNNDTGMFVTLFLAVLDLRSGHLSFSNAGHNPPLLVGDAVVSILSCDANIPVGVMSGFNYTEQHLQLHPGDSIFLYTDGLNEAEDCHQQQFGLERVQQVARTSANYPQHLIEAMTASVKSFVGDAEQSDDLTMLAVKYTFNPTESSC